MRGHRWGLIVPESGIKYDNNPHQRPFIGSRVHARIKGRTHTYWLALKLLNHLSFHVQLLLLRDNRIWITTCWKEWNCQFWCTKGFWQSKLLKWSTLHLHQNEALVNYWHWGSEWHRWVEVEELYKCLSFYLVLLQALDEKRIWTTIIIHTYKL